MSACIGWEDGECPVHGQFHGCLYDADEHPNKVHECLCGARYTGRVPR